MGAWIDFGNYGIDVDREAVQNLWDKIAEKNSDYQCGLKGPIYWDENLVFDNYDKAMEYFDEECDTPLLAVKYKSENVLVHSKAYERKKILRDKALHKYKEADKEFYFKDAKSTFITCRHCKSRILKKYLKDNSCPVCKNDLRPESVLSRIDKLRQRYVEYDNEVETLGLIDKENNKRKTGLRWLVKIEFHI